MTITQAIDFGVRRAATTDRTAVAATVAAAFFDDPLTQWLLPDVVRRQEVILPAFEAYVDPYLPHGETYLTSDSNGAAVWLPPNTELFTADQEHAFGEALADLLGPDADRAFRLGEIFANHHPDEPLYYCQFLATVPAFQAAASGRPSSGTCCSAPTPRGCRRTTKRRRPGTGPCTSGTATSATESSHTARRRSHPVAHVAGSPLASTRRPCPCRLPGSQLTRAPPLMRRPRRTCHPDISATASENFSVEAFLAGVSWQPGPEDEPP